MEHLDEIVSNIVGTAHIERGAVIQTLWSGYGQIIRYHSDKGPFVVKYINPPSAGGHPRGWATDIGHQRKLKSYEVEWHWYHSFHKGDAEPHVPALIGGFENATVKVIVLEDIDHAGYPVRHAHLDIVTMKLCLTWLAKFHARYMDHKAVGLWETGTYWHLATRPEELKVLSDQPLKNAASDMDQILKNCPQTLVHGDAKLANFCFSEDDSKVAAVDFQYVGGGCGMKDVAYFIGSCLVDEQCQQHEQTLLDHYYDEFQRAMTNAGKSVRGEEVVHIWRGLYHVAWADFHRFMKGWSPGHWKVHGYSERVSRIVIQNINNGVYS